MTAEIVNGTDGPQIELHFQTQAEYVAWRWLRSQAQDNCRLKILSIGDRSDYPAVLIGPWPPPAVFRTGSVVKSSGRFDKNLASKLQK